MVKKYYSLVVVALVALTSLFTLSSCKDNPDTVATYTLAFDLAFENVSDAEKAKFQDLIDACKKVESQDITLNQAKAWANSQVDAFRKVLNEKEKELAANQKIILNVNVHKGASASGKVVYSATLVAPDNDAISRYTLAHNVEFENIPESELVKFKDLIEASKETVTSESTPTLAKEVVNNSIQKFQKVLNEEVKKLSGNQEIVFTASIFKGSAAEGTPYYSKTIVATKDGAVIK